MDVLIVGASGGIGQALAENYTVNGHHVIGTYCKTVPPKLSESIDLVPMDPSQDAEVQNLLSKISSLDLVINCVGFLSSEDGLPEKPYEDSKPVGLRKAYA